MVIKSNERQMSLLIGFDYQKFIIEVFFNDLIDYGWGISIFKKIRFYAFYIIMKRFPTVINFKRRIY